MIFTDEMLRCLEQALAENYYDGLTREEMYALLARLHTAESKNK